jgi:hypothetical protein
MTTILERDLDVIALVAEFKQLRSDQVHSILFHHLSASPCDRTLKRLFDRGYLDRVERQTVGGTYGGSGTYVYQVAQAGHRLLGHEGRAKLATSVNLHTLAIADCYIALLELEREGKLVLSGYATEPHCHTQIGSFHLHPDLYLEFQRPSGSTVRLMLEVDMTRQGEPDIADKFRRYWGGFDAGVEFWPRNQAVLFVARKKERGQTLIKYLDKLPVEERKLFAVILLENFKARVAMLAERQ